MAALSPVSSAPTPSVDAERSSASVERSPSTTSNSLSGLCAQHWSLSKEAADFVPEKIVVQPAVLGRRGFIGWVLNDPLPIKTAEVTRLTEYDATKAARLSSLGASLQAAEVGVAVSTAAELKKFLLEPTSDNATELFKEGGRETLLRTLANRIGKGDYEIPASSLTTREVVETLRSAIDGGQMDFTVAQTVWPEKGKGYRTFVPVPRENMHALVSRLERDILKNSESREALADAFSGYRERGELNSPQARAFLEQVLRRADLGQLPVELFLSGNEPFKAVTDRAGFGGFLPEGISGPEFLDGLQRAAKVLSAERAPALQRLHYLVNYAARDAEVYLTYRGETAEHAFTEGNSPSVAQRHLEGSLESLYISRSWMPKWIGPDDSLPPRDTKITADNATDICAQLASGRRKLASDQSHVTASEGGGYASPDRQIRQQEFWANYHDACAAVVLTAGSVADRHPVAAQIETLASQRRVSPETQQELLAYICDAFKVPVVDVRALSPDLNRVLSSRLSAIALHGDYPLCKIVEGQHLLVKRDETFNLVSLAVNGQRFGY